MVFKESFQAPIAKILQADYRLDSNHTDQLIVCAQDGEVRGLFEIIYPSDKVN